MIHMYSLPYYMPVSRVRSSILFYKKVMVTVTSLWITNLFNIEIEKTKAVKIQNSDDWEMQITIL